MELQSGAKLVLNTRLQHTIYPHTSSKHVKQLANSGNHSILLVLVVWLINVCEHLQLTKTELTHS